MRSQLVNKTAILYKILLRVYPRELRERYGEEMLSVFVQQIRSAPERRDVLCAIVMAVGETLTIAAPRRVLAPEVFISGIAVTLTGGVFFSLAAVLQDRALAAWIDRTFFFACR